MPRMIRWDDWKYYSPAHDAIMARVSGFDERHQEHWCLIPAGKGYSQRRKDAVFAIMDHIEQGGEPGEVEYTGETA